MMSKQNKITSYFRNPALSYHNKKDKVKKNNIIHDPDCFIIENVESARCHGDTIIEPEETQTQPNTPNMNAKLEVVALNENEENSQDIFEGFDYDDDILAKSLEEFESSQNISDPQADYDDTTIFFLKMVENFLEKENLFYLFQPCEIKLMEDFLNLSSGYSKKIFVRLYWLQWKWYRASDIIMKYLKKDFSKCSFSQTAVKLLQSGGFLLDGVNDMSFFDWMSILLRPELIKICSHFKINTTKADKHELTNKLKKICSTKSTMFHHTIGGGSNMEKNVLKIIQSHVGECFKIHEHAKNIFDKLHLIVYLGVNPAILREKKLNLLLMNLKNGKQFFPAMSIHCDSVDNIFATQEHFNAFHQSHLLYEEILKLTMSPPLDHTNIIRICKKCFHNYKNIESNDRLNTWSPPIWLHGFTPGYRYIKCMEISIGSYKAMKNDECLKEALDILTVMLNQNKYRQHKRALWHNEKVFIIQARLKQHEQAANLLIQALLETTITDDAKAPLIERAKRLASQKNINLCLTLRKKLLELVTEPSSELPFIEIYAKTTDENFPGKKAKYVHRDELTYEKSYSSVEQYAALHYINNTPFTRGEHWEGRIITSIFVLLFWDIIYSPVENQKGIFISIYQDSPLDLYTDRFYQNRIEKIKTRLLNIEIGWSSIDSIIDFMQDVYISRNEGEVSLFSDAIEWQKIAEITHCLGRKGLLCICERLSTMYYYAHSGFPDLTIWNPENKKIKFVEVKGDGDKLSHKQIQWMNHLLKYGIETEVCYVHRGTNLKTTKAKGKSGTQPKKRKSNESTTSSQDTCDVKNTPKKNIVSPKVKSNIKICSPTQSNTFLESENSNREMKSPSTSKKISVPTTPKSKKSPNLNVRSPNTLSPFESPNKSSPKKRLSLALTRRKLFEKDT